MTFKLYGRKNSGSAAVEVLLRIAGMSCEIIDVQTQADGTAPPWFLAINARGQVPALGLPDGSVMTESAAIMLYLADLPECTRLGLRLAPAASHATRPAYLRWMVYLSAVVYDTALRYFYASRFSVDASHADAIQAQAAVQLDADLAYLASGAHPTGPFLLGSNLSAVDIYAAMLLGWVPDLKALFKRQPRLERLYAAVTADAEIRSVFDQHELP